MQAKDMETLAGCAPSGTSDLHSRPAMLAVALATLSSFMASADSPAWAASATASLPVSVTVSNNCTITTTAVGFPAYDPVGTHATAADDSTSGSVTITCTKGAVTTIGLGLGTHASGSQARMQDGPGEFLNYALYQDANRTVVWGNSSPNLFSPPAAPSKAPRTYSVYGRIPGGQDVSAGTYADTVVATVNF